MPHLAEALDRLRSDISGTYLRGRAFEQLVDFMLRSAEAVCCRHFGKSLSDPEVEILDPFTGTGTFISRLLTIADADGEPLIPDTNVARRYGSQLHANDLVLLAYYIAALKIEQSAASRGVFEDGYRPFDGIVLRDTFSALPDGRFDLDHNPRQAGEQDTRSIRVIIGNPPWSAGQRSAGDDNPNRQHIHIAQRVRNTYGARHKQVRVGRPAATPAVTSAFRLSAGPPTASVIRREKTTTATA